MSFSRVAPVGFQPFYRCFDWSRHLWPMAQTAADVPGARGGELKGNRTEAPNIADDVGRIRLRDRGLFHVEPRG